MATNINPFGPVNAVLPTTTAPVVNDLETNDPASALSAAQGVELKSMIDNIPSSGGQSGGTAEVQNADYVAWLKACKMRLFNIARTRWSPVISMPRTNTVENTTALSFSAGSVLIGIPYADTREVNKFVGHQVSVYTFLTAVHNRYSFLYTECIHKNSSRSAYGKTYTGTDQSATYYGTHCSAAVDYIIGAKCNYSSRQHISVLSNSASTANWLTNLGNPTADRVRMFDIIWQNGHCRIVSNIVHNADGSVYSVEITESRSALQNDNTCIHLTSYTASNFNSTFNSSTYKLLRPDYTALGTDFEDLSAIQYNDDICTIAGDRASFRKGDTIGINYTIKSGSSYDRMLIKRNNVVVKTITGLTQNDESTTFADHFVDLTSENLAQGLYTAVLSNSDGTTLSEPTYFEVIDTQVTCSYSNNVATVGFNSERGLPVCADFVSGLYHNAVRWYFTDEERTKSVAEIPVQTEWGRQKSNYSYSDSLSNLRLRVLFRGEYGTVNSELITTTITVTKT